MIRQLPALLKFSVLLTGALMLSLTAHAQSEEAPIQLNSTLYSPEYCQFMAQFPEEPYRTHKCEGNEQETCYDLVSYTKVFELSSTVSVSIICNPATPAMYEHFTTETMEKTVRAMTQTSVIEAFKVQTKQADGYRLASLLGKGRKGLDESIYIAQLWVAENSIMSVEAELSGGERDDANQLFAELLRNIGYTKEIMAAIKDGEQPAEEPTQETQTD